MTYFNASLAYRAASLETAACLWEAVLDLEQGTCCTLPENEREAYAAMIRATREQIGTVALRLTVIGWTDAVDKSWLEADGCEDMGRGGEYGGPFDWEIPHILYFQNESL